jgi:FkbM family methyltransferase
MAPRNVLSQFLVLLPIPVANTFTCNFLLTFSDTGSNIGVQVRKLFEPEKFKDAAVLPYFQKYFKTNQPGSDYKLDVCAIGFEANPSHFQRNLNPIQTTYNKFGWKTIFYHRAASDVDDQEIKFYSDGAAKHNFWGASTIPWGGDAMKNNSYTVKTVDLALLVKNIIDFHKPEAVLMKIDIEGSEYKVIPNMIAHGAFCNVDAAWIEWHPNFLKYGDEKKNKVKSMVESVSKYGKGNCRGNNFEDLDDESYHRAAWDGGPR